MYPQFQNAVGTLSIFSEIRICLSISEVRITYVYSFTEDIHIYRHIQCTFRMAVFYIWYNSKLQLQAAVCKMNFIEKGEGMGIHNLSDL